MSHYYGDDDDLGERMDADALQAQADAVARRAAKRARHRELAADAVMGLAILFGWAWCPYCEEYFAGRPAIAHEACEEEAEAAR